jgi:hypothetical protein
VAVVQVCRSHQAAGLESCGPTDAMNQLIQPFRSARPQRRQRVQQTPTVRSPPRRRDGIRFSPPTDQADTIASFQGVADKRGCCADEMLGRCINTVSIFANTLELVAADTTSLQA